MLRCLAGGTVLTHPNTLGRRTVDHDRPPVLDVAHWPAQTLLGSLDQHGRSLLSELGAPKNYEPGENILAQGDYPSHVVLLLSGVAKVTVRDANGDLTLLALRFGGDVLGEMGVLEDRLRYADVTAFGHVRARRIEASLFANLLREHSSVTLKLMQVLAHRLRWADERRLDFSNHDAKTRVARVLEQIAESYGDRRELDRYEIPLGQEELAQLAGAGKRVTQDALKELDRIGAIHQGYRKVTITNRPELQRVAKKVS